MKDNNKNRKLKFIRDKNNLRLGISKFYCIEKVSNLVREKSISEDYMERLIETAKKSLMKTFKLSLGRVDLILLSMEGDDFVKDLHTNGVILKRGQGLYIIRN